MEIVKNLNTLKALQKKYKIEYDKDFKYITKTKNLEEKNLYINNKEYKIKYVSGCFYPYLTKTNRTSASYKNFSFCGFYSIKNKGCVYKLNQNLTNEQKEVLTNKYFNIEFYKTGSIYAPELRRDAVLIKNKYFFK